MPLIWRLKYSRTFSKGSSWEQTQRAVGKKAVYKTLKQGWIYLPSGHQQSDHRAIALFSNFIKSLRRHRHESWVRLGVGCWVCQAIYSEEGVRMTTIKKKQFVWGKKVGKLEKAGSHLGVCLEKKDEQGGLEIHCDRLSTKLRSRHFGHV